MWRVQVLLPNGTIWDKKFDFLSDMLIFTHAVQSAGLSTKHDGIEFPSLWRPL